MQRHKIIIGNQAYIVDKLDNLTQIKKQFIMLRKYDYEDQLTFDTDIFVIEKTIYDKWKDDKFTLAFPNTYFDSSSVKNVTNFSSSINNFNNSFSYNDNDYCPIYGDDKELAHILCDTIRIYHPHTKINNNLIIYIDTRINNIHFHLYCATIDNLATYSETEFTVDNIYYSEYVDVIIPNIEQLFNNTFYDDSLNNIIGYDDTHHLPMNLFKTKFIIIQEDNNFYKQYLEDKKDNIIDSSYFSSNINVTLFPYSHVDDFTNLYLSDESYSANTVTFSNNIKFAIKASFVLDELPIIKCQFTLPENSIYDNIIDAYQYYNNVTLEEYKGIFYEDSDDADDDEAELYGDEDGKEMKMCGFQIQIATDTSFRNIIYDETNWDFEFDDFSFQLNGIFDNWNQYPDILICRAKFIDRYLGSVIYSNNVMITKDHYKYLLSNGRIKNIIDVENNVYNIDIIFNEGINKIVINGKTYRKDSSFTIIPGTKITYYVYTKEGYEIKEDKISIIPQEDYTISPEATIIQIPVSIIKNENIEYIEVNGVKYVDNNNLVFNYGTKLVWSSKPFVGYYITNEYENNDIILKNKSGYIISPIADIYTIPINIYYDYNIEEILVTINGIKKTYQYLDYESNCISFNVDYGTNIKIEPKIRIGYELIQEFDNNFIATDIHGYNIILNSGGITGLIQLIIDEGISEIIVNNKHYDKSIDLYFNYGDRILWQARLDIGYNFVENSETSGFIEINDETRTAIIYPKAEIIQIPVNLEFNEGIDKIFINDVEYTKDISNPLYFNYNTKIVWNISLLKGYESNKVQGELTLDNINKIYTISPKASLIQIPLRITFDSGINNITLYYNNIEKVINYNREIFVDYGTNVNWIANCKIGYETSIDEDNFCATDIINGYDIIVNTSKIQIPVHVKLNQGINSITVNYDDKNVQLYNDSTFTVNYGTLVSWKSSLDMGYYSNNPNGYIIAIEELNISPDVQIYQIDINITINQGIKSFRIKTVYNDEIESIEYNEAGSYQIQVKYNTLIEWEVELEEGYKYSGNLTDNFYATKISGYTIDILPKKINLFVYIRINKGINYIEVNGNRYTSNTTLSISYGEKIEWIAYSNTGYRFINNFEDTIEKITENITIEPKTELLAVPVSIIINPGIDYIEILSKKYDKDTELSFKYGSNINYFISIKEGYKLIGENKQTLALTSLNRYIISPEANITQIPVYIKVNTGIDSIIVNGEIFNKNITKKFDYNTNVKWNANVLKGYNCENNSGEFICVDNNGYEISPIATPKIVHVYVELSTGIKYITVNNERYYNNVTLSFKYGTLINWFAELQNGYRIKDKDKDWFVAEKYDDGHIINPSAEEILIPIRIKFSEGVERIFVNDIEYTENTTIEVRYNTNIYWYSVINKNYNGYNDKGNFNAVLNSGHDIAPITTRKPIDTTITIELEYFEDNNNF